MSKDRVLELFARTPQPSLREIAEAVGLSRERVRQILAAEGLKSAHGPTGRPRGEPGRVWKNRFGHPYKISTGNLGVVSELLVAADLLSRGWDVYSAVGANCAADVVACDGANMQRVEVRSANLGAGGAWKYNAKPKVVEDYDVLALVLPDGSIRYEPDPFSGVEPTYSRGRERQRGISRKGS